MGEPNIQKMLEATRDHEERLDAHEGRLDALEKANIIYRDVEISQDVEANTCAYQQATVPQVDGYILIAVAVNNIRGSAGGYQQVTACNSRKCCFL